MSKGPWSRLAKQAQTGLVALIGLAAAGLAAAQVTVTVVDDNGAKITNGFRWVLEEDNSYGIRKTAPDGPWAGPAGGSIQYPGTPSPTAGLPESYTLGVNIHHSHSTTVCSGDTDPLASPIGPNMNAGTGATIGAATVTIQNTAAGPGFCAGYDPAKNYMVSVLPWHSSPAGVAPNAQTGWGQSGRNIAAGQTTVKVVVHAFPQPTGQITILVFEDNQSINAAYDQPSEHGLKNFQLLFTDPAGQTFQDAWTNPIGTTYLYECADEVIVNGVPFQRPVDCNTLLPLAQGQQPVFQRDGDGLPIPDFVGDGSIYTCPGGTDISTYTPYQRANCVDPYTLAPMAAGEAVIRYLSQNKYTIEPSPPHSGVDCGDSANSHNCSDMLLTGTLEGTRGNDAWIRGGEPRYNISLGQLNWLCFYGFVHPMSISGGSGSIHGQVVYTHDSHPPLSPGLFNVGPPVQNAYVGLNNLSGNDEQVYTGAANPSTGEFTISGIPAGNYLLSIWDKPINAIIDYRTITVGSGAVELGPVPVFGWFGTVTGSVFSDLNAPGEPGYGRRDAGEPGIANIPVNVRFTDGSTWGTTNTDASGEFSFGQYFAWWRFLIPEVDSSRYKSTGVTSIVDNGGALTDASVYPGNGQTYAAMGINPQLQSCDAGNAGCLANDGGRSRTEKSNTGLNDGPVTTQALQLFQDMTARFDWGKQTWSGFENGGIKGKINYATTRTGEDPRYDVEDGWEPGIPRVKVQLWRAVKDMTNLNVATNLGWVKADLTPIWQTSSSSWDDNVPTGCVGAQGTGLAAQYITQPEIVNGLAIPSCAEIFHNWDQTRNGIYDGQYRLDRYCPGGYDVAANSGAGGCILFNGDTAPQQNLLPGNYIVQVIKPEGYTIEDWGTRNIEFGDPKIPFLTEIPPCIGAPYDVPEFHTLFPDQEVPTDTTVGGMGVWAPGLKAASCDTKYVALNPGANQTTDFHMFTYVPKAAHCWGTVWNDLALEFNPLSPNASGNLAVSYLPVSIKDWKGTEVARFYTDQWGHFDGLVPTNYDIAPPIPLGLVLAMLTVAPNDPGPILDTQVGSATQGQWITDPFFNPAYSVEVIRENWEFYPGRTTFIDTIVIPLAGFVANRVGLNCSIDNQPELMQVSDVVIPTGGRTITLTSMGYVTGPNPGNDPANPASPQQVTFNHGFGAGATVSVNGIPLAGAVYGAPDIQGIDTISVNVPDSAFPSGVNTGQLIVTSANGRSTTAGITLHYNPALVVDAVAPPLNCVGLACGGPDQIQAKIDNALPGTLILVHPGTNYQENLNLWKPVTLQGFGAPVTVLDGTAASANFALKQRQFDQILSLNAAGFIGLVPDQASDFVLEQGSGILVGGCGVSPACGSGNSFYAPGAVAQIDGLTITGASEAGGGVLVHGFVKNLKVTNNEIVGNQGSIGGGVRVGESALIGAANPTGSSFNPDVTIDHNRIAQNGSLFDGGGGVAVYAGSDGYQITNNMLCGNFSANYGGGIGHFGLSLMSASGRTPLIQGNLIVANESFDEGGGIHVAGENPVAGAVPALTIGSGSVIINQNLIQGNKAGDDGGGVRTLQVNGMDVYNNPGNASNWYQVDIFNNMIVNNSSADQGGGIALDDTVIVNIVNNTIARNDSTATGSDAFGGPCTETSPVTAFCPTGEAVGGFSTSSPQVAGISSFMHSTPLQAALARTPLTTYSTQTFSDPVLRDDILWQNRSFYWDATANGGLGALVPRPGAGSPYWDLGVSGFGGAGPTMSPTYSLLTDGVEATPSATNLIGTAPLFVGGCPLGTGTGGQPTGPVTSGVGSCFDVYQGTQAGAALGNFVTVTFTPTGIQGDYHLEGTSPGINAGTAAVQFALQSTDYDGQARPMDSVIDMGADETLGTGPPPPPPPPVLAVLDDFNRANATNLNTGAPAGVAWNQLAGGQGQAVIRANANQALSVSLFGLASRAYWNGDGAGSVFGTTQAAAFTFGNATRNMSALVLKASLGTANAPSRYIRVRYNTGSGGQILVETTTNNITFTNRGTLAGAFAAGDRLTVEADATGLVTVWKTTAASVSSVLGTVQLPTTGLNAWTTETGRIGIQLPSFGARVDNFAGGSL